MIYLQSFKQINDLYLCVFIEHIQFEKRHKSTNLWIKNIY